MNEGEDWITNGERPKNEFALLLTKIRFKLAGCPHTASDIIVGSKLNQNCLHTLIFGNDFVNIENEQSKYFDR